MLIYLFENYKQRQQQNYKNSLLNIQNKVSKYNQFTQDSKKKLEYKSQMNYQYQHKKGPPKMIKDLKFGANVHLRQSLLDIAQIQNLNKIFIGRKDHYSIEDQNYEQTNKQKQNTDSKNQNQFQTQFIRSPQQNLLFIKKQRLTNMMKDKMNKMFKQKQIYKYRMRKPVLHNMLEQFKNSFRVEDQPKFRQSLKNSEKQLQHIKINSKKRISTNYQRQDTSKSRSKFISISTGKPLQNQIYFPSFNDFVQGKYKIRQETAPGIDISKIDNYLNTLITQPYSLQRTGIPHTDKKNNKQQYLKYVNRQISSKTQAYKSRSSSPDIVSVEDSIFGQKISSISVLNKNPYQTTCFNRKFRSKSAKDPNSTFVKSQQSSKKIIDAMQTYYNVKKQKNLECDSVVEYLKKDRPLTSHLRRKNYTVVGKSQLDDLNKYRKKSEQQRIRILEKNYSFYISLLKMFQHCNQAEILGSLQILERLKQFFESQYVLLQKDVDKLCRVTKGRSLDFGVAIIQQNLLDYAKKQQSLFVQNQQEYQIL